MKKLRLCPTCETINEVFHFSPILQLEICEGCKQDLSVEVDYFSQREFREDELPKDTVLYYAFKVLNIPFYEIIKRALIERMQNYKKIVASRDRIDSIASITGENIDVIKKRYQKAIEQMESKLMGLEQR